PAVPLVDIEPVGAESSDEEIAVAVAVDVPGHATEAVVSGIAEPRRLGHVLEAPAEIAKERGARRGRRLGIPGKRPALHEEQILAAVAVGVEDAESRTERL